MAENSKIEWTTHTFNPWIGCQKVSSGCDHCYAETLMDKRYGKVQWGPHGERKRTSESNWKLPLRWARQARKSNSRPRVFCASLADVFDNKAPAGARDDLFATVRATPELDWLFLTKRPENICKMLPADWGDGYANVWLGTTCEDQAAYDRRWPILREIPAHIRFISYEPAIGPLRLHNGPDQPDWLICGGESGPGARYMEPAWAGDILADCEMAGVFFFMKQMTAKRPVPAYLLVRQFPATKEAGER